MPGLFYTITSPSSTLSLSLLLHRVPTALGLFSHGEALRPSGFFTSLPLPLSSADLPGPEHDKVGHLPKMSRIGRRGENGHEGIDLRVHLSVLMGQIPVSGQVNRLIPPRDT